MQPLTPLATSGTDPTELFRQRDGIYAADLLVAAVCWLGLFSWLADRPADLAGVCHGLGIQPRPADVMLTLFTALGLVSRDRDVFRLTEVAREHLVRASPHFIGPYFAALRERAVCLDLVTVLRSGTPAGWCSVPGEQSWTSKMDGEPFADMFTAAMDARATVLAPALARRVDCGHARRLLDIAGGSGVYACTMMAANPTMTAAVLEKPPVDAIARRSIAQRGLADRVAVVAGDMFAAPLPGGYDVHLWSNVLHDWDLPEVTALLGRSFEALPPGGMLLIHDAHLNPDKSGPLPVAAYSVLLMHSTPGRCYSIAELEEVVRRHGFVDVGYADLAVDRSIITARKPT